MRPAPGLRIQRLAGTGQVAQAVQVVLLRILWTKAHEHTYGRRRSEHDRHAMALDNAPDHARVGIIRRPFAEHRGGPSHQRRIDNIAMADDPANVRGAEEHVLITEVPERLQMVIRSHHVAAMHV